MSKAITGEMIMTGAATRTDGSLSFRLVTQEIPADQKAAIMELQGIVLSVLIQPANEKPEAIKEIKGEFEHKTPSQRLRNTIFVWWNQMNKPGQFEDFYRRRMEDIINEVKTQLNPV